MPTEHIFATGAEAASDIAARIPALLEFASLTHKKDAKIPTLSGGLKRRLTLAGSVVHVNS